MEDNKRDSSEFLNSRSKESDFRDEQSAEQGAQNRPSYYYSYGPHKSGMQEEHSEGMSSFTSNSGNHAVEVTPPRPIRAYGLRHTDRESQQSSESWTSHEPRRRSTFRSMFAAFLAGAVFVSGLMFVSDKMNLFSGNAQPTNSLNTSGGAAASAPNNNSNDGNLKTAVFADGRPTSFAQVVDKSSPAVVLVKSYVKQKQSSRRGTTGTMLDDPIFRYFFGDGGTQQQPNNGGTSNDSNSGTLKQVGIGSGFIFEQSGYILTNEHVIDGADEVHIVMEGSDKEFIAKVVGSSYDYDLAVLKIEGEKVFPTLPLGNPDETAIGDWVIAIGNPLGFDHTVTVGVLSAKERPIDIPDNNGTRSYRHLLQTDASINPGNSGGPLINMAGEVIGINTAVSAQAQGIGFAIPTSTIKNLLPNLKTGTKIPRPPAPYIGVTPQDIDARTQKLLKLDSTQGALVYNVLPGGPAFKAGVKQYDVITSIAGEKIVNSEDLKKKTQTRKVGEKVSLSIIRDGKSMTIDLTIGDMNNDEATQPKQ